MEKVSFREILFLLKMSRDLQMLFAAITHLLEGLSLETFLTLKVEKSLIIIQFNNNNNNKINKVSNEEVERTLKP
jgi:hypothetical protein